MFNFFSKVSPLEKEIISKFEKYLSDQTLLLVPAGRSLSISENNFKKKLIAAILKEEIAAVLEYEKKQGITLNIEDPTDKIEILKEVNVSLTPIKIKYIFKRRLNQALLNTSFNTNTIEKEIMDIFKSTFTNKILLKEVYDSISKKLNITLTKNQKKQIEELFLLYHFKKYKIPGLSFSDYFVIQEEDNSGKIFTHIFTTEKTQNVESIRSISTSILTKGHYIFNYLPLSHFNEIKEIITTYEHKKIPELSMLKCDFLKAYFVNSLTNPELGDLSLEHYQSKELNVSVKMAFQFTGGYKIIEIEEEKTLNLNDLGSDLALLGARQEGVVTDGLILLGGNSYRLSLLKVGIITSLSLRKTERQDYTIDELNMVAGEELNSYLISDNGRVKININKEYKEQLTYPLAYQDADSEKFMNIFNSATKGTFWICGATGSGKSETLKAVLKEVYNKKRKEKEINIKLMTLEHPVEALTPYYTQLDVDDREKEDFQSIMVGLKRQKPDVIVFGETRSSEVLPELLDLADSNPTYTSIHAATLPAFLTKCKLYANSSPEITDVSDIYDTIGLAVIQTLSYSFEGGENLYYTDDEVIADLKNKVVANPYKMKSEDIRIVKAMEDLLSQLKEKNIKLIRSNPTGKKKIKLFYEYATAAAIKEFQEDSLTPSEIYAITGARNSLLYQQLKSAIKGEVIYSIAYQEQEKAIIEEVLNILIEELSQK